MNEPILDGKTDQGWLGGELGGYMSFYWGRTIVEYAAATDKKEATALIGGWLEYFKKQAVFMQQQ